MTLLQEIRKKWPPRPPAAHKGDFGRVFILAGSRGYTGAAYLASMAAVRAGAGLVTLGVPEAVYPILARRSVEVMVRPLPSTRAGALALRAWPEIRRFASTQDVFAIGPGLSRQGETAQLVRKILEHHLLPAVVDADGLNAFEGASSSLARAARGAILTPHPGEFKRLFGCSAGTSESARRRQAAAMARKFHTLVILKGRRTVVASPTGKIYINTTGNAGMATGGTGDVLTGMIAALLGQKFSFWDAARFSVFLHGRAADLAIRKTGEVSLAAGDLLDYLPQAILQVRRK